MNREDIIKAIHEGEKNWIIGGKDREFCETAPREECIASAIMEVLKEREWTKDMYNRDVCDTCGAVQHTVPEWEQRINIFAERLDHETERDKGTKQHTVFNYNGKRIGDYLKDFIRSEFKKLGEEVAFSDDQYFRELVQPHIDKALKKRGVDV